MPEHHHRHHWASHQWTLHSGSLGPAPTDDLARLSDHAAAVAAHRRQHLRGSPLADLCAALGRWAHGLRHHRAHRAGAPS